MEVLQDLDDSFFETWDLETIFDAEDKTDGVYLRAHVFEQATNEGWIDSHTRTSA
jgi:hypothetical protein